MDIKAKKSQEREVLRNVIAQWNANRLDLFALCEPNEDLEFHGVMRFYFQDAGQKVATKCIRVSSTAVTLVVIETLIEKFRPDMRMLSIPEYALYEIHENGEERKLGEEEKPLLVQLNWHRDDREGRFLLRRMDEKTYIAPQYFEESNFKRKLSKREKREKKKKEKLQRIEEHNRQKDQNGIAERLYSELPETSFTRSISNPEAVMRRRRQQKLEKKLQQFRSRDGGPDTGGTLKIYGETLCKDVPYKTLLLSIRDTAAQVVKEMLLKYGLDKEDPINYCLVQSFTMAGEGENKDAGANPGNEYILDDDECPLAVPMNYPAAKGTMTFHVRRRPPDYQPRKRKKKPKSQRSDMELQYKDYMEKLPFFIELNPDGSDILHGNACKHHLHLNVTEVGSERSTSSRGQYLQLFGPNIYPRHCVIAHTEGIITVTPCSRDADTYVNGQRIVETTILQNGMIVRFGPIHNFRFLDPSQDEKRLRHESAPGQGNDYLERQSQKDDSSLHASVLENSYDGADGENLSLSSHKEETRPKKDARPPIYERFDHRRGHDAILPAVLEFREDAEDAFLMAVLINIESKMVQFKLAPTYILYMASRYRASTHYRQDITPNERALRLTALQNKVATMMQHVIQDKYNDAMALAFYMANASELLHFLKQDRHISAYSLDAQDLLADNVQIAFRSLVQCLQVDFQSIMPVFLDERDQPMDEEHIAGEILAVLSATMSLLRRCRVNAALTIQLFSQLFHFVNMWLFNCLVGDVHPNYCNRHWGMRLKRRLAHIELWAEKQGLELAADCHLSRIAQAAHLLQSPKSSPDDIAIISSTCFKLNSLQLKALLEKYDPMPDEPRIPQELINNVVKVAENTADELARTDGRDIRLCEDSDLQLPFLLPEDGYSCDIVRGVPAGLQEFLQPLEQANLCRLTIQPTSSGYWTIYMADQDVHQGMHSRHAGSLGQHSASAMHDLSRVGKEPEIASIRLQKSNNGMGLSIVAAKGIGQDKLGIYIKSVVKGGAADVDGRLQAGDQLLKVDGQSLVGLSQEKAAEYMTQTGPQVTLEVAKQGAIYHGLATILNQPSPVMHRGHANVHRYSERDIPGRISRDQVAEMDPRFLPRIHGSKSVPSLLNGPNPQEPMRMPLSGNLKPPQEVFNPGYSRASSTASMKGSEQHLPAKEIQGPYPESNVLPHHQQTAHGPQSSPQQEERFYQNISIYQQDPHQNPKPNFGEYPHSPKSPSYEEYRAHTHSPISKPLQQAQPQQPTKVPNNYQPPFVPAKSPHLGHLDDGFNRSHRSSQSSLHRNEPPPTTAPRDRPLSALVSQREREQFLDSAPHVGMYTQKNDSYQKYGPGPPHQMQSPQAVRHSSGNPYDSENKENAPYEHAPEGFHSSTQRISDNRHGQFRENIPNNHELQRSEKDFLRQEAKMEEMREEVRRREERSRMDRDYPGKGAGTILPHGTYPQRSYPGHGKIPPHQQLPPNQNLSEPNLNHAYKNQHPQQHLGSKHPPPPPAPKPKVHYVQGPEKPQRQQQQMHEMPMNGYATSQDIPPERPPLPDEVHLYRDSPPPPPPPPATTHPLVVYQRDNFKNGYMQGHRQGPMHPQSPISNEKQAFHHSHYAQNYDPRLQEQSGKNYGGPADPTAAISPSPWEREEREKEQSKRLAEAHRMRDHEIEQLESCPHRTSKQEERLRTLRLEQEFQRRAEELKNDDDDENEDDDDVIDRQSMLRKQDEMYRPRRQEIVQNEQARKSYRPPSNELEREEKRQGELPNSNLTTDEWLKRQQDIKNQRREQREEEERQKKFKFEEERLRQQKMEEVQRKREQERAAMRELQAARQAEERLLREAQRRQEEDMKMQKMMPYQAQAVAYPHQQYQSNDALHMQGHAVQNSYGPQQGQGYYPNPMQHSSGYGATQRLDNLVSPTNMPGAPKLHNEMNQNSEAPYPHQGNYKYAAHPEDSYPQAHPITKSHAMVNSNSQEVVAPKRVSFHDAKLETAVPYDGENKHYKNNNTYNGSSNAKHSSPMLSPVQKEVSFYSSPPENSPQTTTFSTGISPGVIGTQEVYRDPRKKIEAQRQSQTNKNPGGEKLSFKEKMKMFALETGEPESPRDKVKISRAQRDIETNLNGS